MIPNSYSGTHMRKVKTFTILARVFFPVGLFFLIGSIIMSGVGIPMMIRAAYEMDAQGACVQTASGVQCSGFIAFLFALSVVLVALGATGFFLGLPMFILSFVFRGIARANRREDEARGIDYSGFPYGN